VNDGPQPQPLSHEVDLLDQDPATLTGAEVDTDDSETVSDSSFYSFSSDDFDLDGFEDVEVSSDGGKARHFQQGARDPLWSTTAAAHAHLSAVEAWILLFTWKSKWTIRDGAMHELLR